MMFHGKFTSYSHISAESSALVGGLEHFVFSHILGF